MRGWKRPRSLMLSLLGVPAVSIPTINPGHADDGVVFSVGTWRDMHAKDRASLEFVLGAMREAVFYARHPIGQPVICAKPIPIEGAELVGMVDDELAHPNKASTDTPQVALVLLTALKLHGACQ